MIKVLFMNPNGDKLDSRDMSLEQVHTLKLADSIDIGYNAFNLIDMDYNVNLQELYVWLRNKFA